jgi:hypothetical protein
VSPPPDGFPPPTHEQTEVIAAFRSGGDMVIQAGAGTGKTLTLQMLSAGERRRGLYIAFNKAIAQQARRRFPPSVRCRTSHSLAYQAVGYAYAHRMQVPRMPSWQVAAILGINRSTTIRIGDRVVTGRTLAYIAMRTVREFCYSASEHLCIDHVPRQRGIDEDHHPELAGLVLPYAELAWSDVRRTEGGQLKVEHDHYLKMWQLRGPWLPSEFILLDEAQDTNPAVEAVVLAQRDHAQLALAGDSAQQIYAWRGARDVMAGFDGRQLPLTQSFRFGGALAAEANRWLSLAGAPIRLRGHPGIPTKIGRTGAPDAILCQTNAGAMDEVMRLLADGRRVALVGGGGPLRDLAQAALDLKAGNGTVHYELLLFKTWGEVQEYVEDDPEGADLLPFVNVIDDLGADTVLAAVTQLTQESDAEVVVSTAHRAKGREWGSVRIAYDFVPPQDAEEGQLKPIPAEFARLAYVAVTRARQQLDLSGLSWIQARRA